MKNDFTLDILKKKSLDFSLQVIAFHESLEGRRCSMSIKVLRAGTRIGELINEAEYGIIKADIISRLTRAAQEANKVIYWLTILKTEEVVDAETADNLIGDCNILLVFLQDMIKITHTERSK